jgi:hypothetical protein
MYQTLKDIDMEDLAQLSNIIDGYYSKSKTEKAIAILSRLRSGDYYYHSNERKFLIGNYKGLVLSFLEEEYNIFKKEIILCIPSLIEDRNQRNVAYSLLSDIITYSCSKNDFDIYTEYETKIFKLAKTNKDKYLYHTITLAQTKNRLEKSIENIEDYFITNFLSLSKLNTICNSYLIDFTSNVSYINMKKFLKHLMALMPFRNDFIVNEFMINNVGLHTLAILL